MTICDSLIEEINQSPKARAFAEIAEDELLLLAIDVAHYLDQGEMPSGTVLRLSRLREKDLLGVYTIAAKLALQGEDDGA